MEKEDQIENRLEKIESQLFQIKIMLVILIALCLLGFSGVLGDAFTMLLWIGVFIGFVYIIVEVINVVVPPKTKQRIDKKLQKIIDKAESQQ
jgi:hypothetical protein